MWSPQIGRYPEKKTKRLLVLARAHISQAENQRSPGRAEWRFSRPEARSSRAEHLFRRAERQSGGAKAAFHEGNTD